MIFKPKVSELPPDVDIVTITGGGNDLHYVGNIIRDAFQASFLGRILLRFLPSLSAVDPEPLTPEDVAQRFIDVIDKVQERSPRCRIFLVEYLTLFGAETRPKIDAPLDQAQLEHHKSVAMSLKKAYRLAAEARSCCKVISVAEASENHCVGSEKPWVDGFSFGMLLLKKAPYHPNISGMEAVAEMLYEELKADEAGL